MTIETAFGAKLTRAGFVPREVRFQIAVAEFLNNGGTADRAHELIAVAADKMESEGQVTGADKAVLTSPPLQTNAAKGSIGRAEKAVANLPDAAAKRNGAGQKNHAAKAVICSPASVSPHRLPGHAKRGAAAIASVQATVSKSLFDTLTLPDGRKIADVPWFELPKIATEYRRASRICMMIYNHGKPADEFATARQTLREDDLKVMVEQAERFNDIH